jgi:wyosine [tRNA(Phe)-imidazoG37] synthetase (radical SAM superfamily)
MRVLYGPVESWRLGRSLGVDPLAARGKRCPFSCLYCQYGRTMHPTLRRRAYLPVESLRASIEARGPVFADCATFAGLGEPTLATNLPALVAVVREQLGLPVILLTGSALLPDSRVRADIQAFDCVIATLNAADEASFRQINRPAPAYPYSLQAIVHALYGLRDAFAGQLVLQVMLTRANLEIAPAIADLVRQIAPDEVQLNTPLQPALGGPIAPDEMNAAQAHFAGLRLHNVYDDKNGIGPLRVS